MKTRLGLFSKSIISLGLFSPHSARECARPMLERLPPTVGDLHTNFLPLDNDRKTKKNIFKKHLLAAYDMRALMYTKEVQNK